MSLARLVLDHPECAPVLRARRLDYCCRGALTVGEASVGKGVDTAALIEELEAAIDANAAPLARDPRTLATRDLLEELRLGHRRFLQRATLTVGPLLVKVARAHGDARPQLKELVCVWGELVSLLEPHVEKEDDVLFPELLSGSSSPSTTERQLRGLRQEHLVIGEQIFRIQTLTDAFSVPADACGSYGALMHELSTLDDDLCRHVHIENHVLMRRFS